MSSSNFDSVETRLIAFLQEYKNPVVLLCFGILIGATFYFKDIPQIYVLYFCLALFFVPSFYRNKKLVILFVAVIFGYLYGAIYFKFFTANLDTFLKQRNVFVGEIQSTSDDMSLFRKKYFLKLSHIVDDSSLVQKTVPVQGCTVQVLGSVYEEYFPGDLVHVTGILKKPKSAVLPSLFDEKRYLFTKGVKYLLVADPGSLVFLDSPDKTLIRREVSKLRNKLMLANKKFLPFDNLSLVNAIVFGSKVNRLPDNLEDAIRSLGLSHIVCASGFNVSILTVGIFYLFRLLFRSNLLPTIVSIFAVLLYLAVADFSSSILRATAFVILVLIGNLYGKKLKILPAVSLFVLIFFLTNPASILDVGLQLSIFAFLGLILFVNKELTKNLFLSIFFQSLFAQIMVLPLIVFYFHNIQLLGLISNLLAVPLASMILIIAVISILFALIPGIEYLSIILCFLLKILSYLFISWVNFLDSIPLKQVFLPNLNFYVLILIYIFIVFSLCCLFVSPLRRRFKLFLIFFVLFFSLVYMLTDQSKCLKIFFLPKYNQEAILVVAPNQKPVFIATRLEENDKRRLRDYLRLNNISYDFVFYDLKKEGEHSFLNPFLEEQKNKIRVRYKNFTLEVIKNYNEKVAGSASFVKLPILRKNDPPFGSIFLSLPSRIIINDYKKLSKKSVSDILWLKSRNIKTFFLSEGGTITLVTDGNRFNILQEV